jgi:hypothetical protein
MLIDKTQNRVQCILTREQIEHDIEAYEDRLRMAQDKLSVLPGRLRGRKLAQTRRALLSEIRHVKTLIGYAQGALMEVAD